MPAPVIVELLIIGNELLIGEIQDTNSHWLCREVNAMGGYVARVTLLRDDAGAIAAEVRAVLARGAEVIFTSGGLGPTADDLTLAAVARGAGVGTRLHEQARQMVRDRFDELAARGILSQGGLNAPREKMAWLPEGGVPLHNPVGTAPGVLLRTGEAAIVSLPGVPAELKGIFTSSLRPFLRETFGGGVAAARTIVVHCNDESLLEPVLSRVVKDHPVVYIKSLARTLGETPEIDITVTGVGSDRSCLDARVDAAVKDLREGLDSLGIVCRDKEKTSTA